MWIKSTATSTLTHPVFIPGTTNRGEGYCIFNDIACAAHVAMRDYGVERVLVIDLDVHQVQEPHPM